MAGLKSKLSMPPAKDPMLEDEDIDLAEMPESDLEGEQEQEYPMTEDEMAQALEEMGYTVSAPEGAAEGEDEGSDELDEDMEY